MASHVRTPREIQNALQWLADSDQDQVKEAAALIGVQHRSTLMTTLSRSFCADDASASSNPWAGFTSDPPASSASTSAKQMRARLPRLLHRRASVLSLRLRNRSMSGSTESTYAPSIALPAVNLAKSANWRFVDSLARIPATRISLLEEVTLVRSVIAKTEIARRRKSRSGATGKAVGNPMNGGPENGSPSLALSHCIWYPASLHAAVTLHCSAGATWPEYGIALHF